MRKRINNMQFYVIAPVANLELMDLGERIFVLAHLWVKFPEYRKFIMERKNQENPPFITLDNSAAERSLVTEDILIDICKELMPDEVIAPDVLFNTEETLANLQHFISRMKKEGLYGKIDIFACPQGTTMDMWLHCYSTMAADPDVNVIGLSKIAVPKAFLNVDGDQQIMEARHMAYNLLKSRDWLVKPIHCLGQGDPAEFKYYDHPMMRSTDSVYPVYAGHLEIDLTSIFKRVATPHSYLEEAEIPESKIELIKSNINFLAECCK